MSKIYLVTEGEYSDYHIIAATTDKKAAERLKKRYTGKWDTPEIEVFEDGAAVADLPLFSVTIYDGGGAVASESGNSYDFAEAGEVSEYGWGEHRYFVGVFAKNKETAIKIASDKVAQYKAKKNGL